MAGVVGKRVGQILGISKGTATGPLTVLTLTSDAPGGTQRPVLMLSPSFLAQLSIGASLTIYFVSDPSDAAAIEAAVTVVPLDGSV